MRSIPRISLNNHVTGYINYPLSRAESGVDEIGAFTIPDITSHFRDMITHEEELQKHFQSLEDHLTLVHSRLEDMTEQQSQQAWKEFSEQINFSGSLGSLVTGVTEARAAVVNSLRELNEYPTMREELWEAFLKDPTPVATAAMFTVLETSVLGLFGFGIAGPVGAGVGLALGSSIGGLFADATTDHAGPLLRMITAINRAADELGGFVSKVEEAMQALPQEASEEKSEV